MDSSTNETAGKYVLKLFVPGQPETARDQSYDTLAEALRIACTYWTAGGRSESITRSGKTILNGKEIEEACARIRVLNPDGHNEMKTVEYVVQQMGK